MRATATAAADGTDAPPPPPAPPYPPPGHIVHYDYREPKTTSSPAPRHARHVLRLAQFNVERGYELEKVARQLAALEADVVALQEVDVGCDRSGNVDVGRALAQRLKMCGVFLCEFEELRDEKRRDARSQGGGAHGNAILSRFDLRHARRVDHSLHPVDWDLPPERQTHRLARKEPRRGKRAALAARVFPPWLQGEREQGRGCRDTDAQEEEEELDGVLIYSAHLEVFCGAADRAAQYADIVADSRRERGREMARWRAGGAAAGAPAPTPRHAVLGDLNTMAHGVARLSPHYAQGALRWRTLGWTEGEWWERHVLWRPGAATAGGDSDEEDDNDDPSVLAARRRLERWGVPKDAARSLLPNPGFACPFPARHTVTLDNPIYRLPLPGWAGRLLLGARRGSGEQAQQQNQNQNQDRERWWLPLMAGKLDWVLLHERGFRVERAFSGNEDFAASDHAWLCVDAEVIR